MAIWSHIGKLIADTAISAFEAVVERVRTVFAGDAATRRSVAFSVAIIALSAKMAKADGVVTDAEVRAFQDVFEVPEDEFSHVARVYNLAKQDIAGFDVYAAQVRSLFPDTQGGDDDILRDVLDALFHIAKADGALHENELLFLESIAEVFGFSQQQFERIRMRHATDAGQDPYFVLDAEPSWSYERLKAQYRKRVAEAHPDRMIARGVPPEFVAIANDRLAAINAAWEAVQAIHRPALPRVTVEA